ncbi:MAG TPA: hypothetical protein VIK64_13210 [Anaerolineales bacterium]
MKLVNRSVLVLKPTANMLDWINSVGEESDPVTPEEAREMTNAYLLPDLEDDEERASFIRFRAKKLFEHELEAWCTDPGKWPTVRSYKAFLAWSRIEVSDMVFDLAGDPIVREDY